MRRAMLAAAVGVAALIIPATAQADDPGLAPFEQCSISGTATFGSPLTGVPGDNSYAFTGGGDCGGDEVVAEVSGSGTLSCGAAEAEGGVGTLTWTMGTEDPDDDVTLPFHMDVAGAGGVIGIHVTGDTSGEAGGVAEFLSSEPDATACAGDGLSELAFNASLVAGPNGAS